MRGHFEASDLGARIDDIARCHREIESISRNKNNVLSAHPPHCAAYFFFLGVSWRLKASTSSRLERLWLTSSRANGSRWSTQSPAQQSHSSSSLCGEEGSSSQSPRALTTGCAARRSRNGTACTGSAGPSTHGDCGRWYQLVSAPHPGETSPPLATASLYSSEVFVFAHPPISPICRTPLFPYLTVYSSFFRPSYGAAVWGRV